VVVSDERNGVRSVVVLVRDATDDAAVLRGGRLLVVVMSRSTVCLIRKETNNRSTCRRMNSFEHEKMMHLDYRYSCLLVVWLYLLVMILHLLDIYV
jgi:hypothetical protein